jgi:hypothetical protein
MLISEVDCLRPTSPTLCQLPKQRRSLARTVARSTSWCASKRMRFCPTSNLPAASAAARFKGARAGSYSNTFWWIVETANGLSVGLVGRRSLSPSPSVVLRPRHPSLPLGPFSSVQAYASQERPCGPIGSWGRKTPRLRLAEAKALDRLF